MIHLKVLHHGLDLVPGCGLMKWSTLSAAGQLVSLRGKGGFAFFAMLRILNCAAVSVNIITKPLDFLMEANRPEEINK